MEKVYHTFVENDVIWLPQDKHLEDIFSFVLLSLRNPHIFAHILKNSCEKKNYSMSVFVILLISFADMHIRIITLFNPWTPAIQNASKWRKKRATEINKQFIFTSNLLDRFIVLPIFIYFFIRACNTLHDIKIYFSYVPDLTLIYFWQCIYFNVNLMLFLMDSMWE